MARIIRNAQPCRITPADRARMAAAVARGERERQRAAAMERIARRCVFAGVIILAVCIFYGVTN